MSSQALSPADPATTPTEEIAKDATSSATTGRGTPATTAASSATCDNQIVNIGGAASNVELARAAKCVNPVRLGITAINILGDHPTERFKWIDVRNDGSNRP
jgi:hypothetical protein